MNNIRKSLVAAILLAAVTASQAATSITNPDTTTADAVIGGAFNTGLGMAVAAGIALLVWGYFRRAAKR